VGVPSRFGEHPGHLLVPALSAIAACVVLAPLMWQRGYVLVGDMVFTPRSPLNATTWGIDGRVPRGVPSDAVVALAERLVSGAVVQRLVLFAICLAAAWGAGRLTESVLGGQRLLGAVGALAYVWTPFLYERLLLGQWALLVGWAALPWVAMTASRRSATLLVPLTLGSLGGASAWLPLAMTAVAVTCFAGGHRRWTRTGLVAGCCVVLALPWALPSVLLPGGISSDPEGFAAFAARADTALGTLPSLLASGGVWNAHVSPPERGSWLTAVVTLVWAALVIVGLVALARARPAAGVVSGLAVAAALGIVVAWSATTGWGQSALGHLAQHVSAAGLLRDSQKLVAPWSLLAAVALAAGAGVLADRVGGAGARVVPAVALLVPLATVPALGGGLAGRLDPVAWPKDWDRAAAAVSADPAPVLVMPWQAYRAYDWNDRRPTLDPSTRWFTPRVVGADTLVVGGTSVSGEDPWAAQLEPLSGDPAALVVRARSLGVGWVLAEGQTPGTTYVPEGRRVVTGASLVLVRVDPTGPPPDVGLSPWVAIVAWGVPALVLTGGAGVSVRRRGGRRLLQSINR
jgi:hypothetical protein